MIAVLIENNATEILSEDIVRELQTTLHFNF